MKRKYLLQILNCVLFLGLAVALVVVLSEISKPDNIKSQLLLYDQVEEDSLDVIFVGSSAVYTFYDVMAIWDEYGITSMTHSASAMPFELTVPFLKQAQETQSPKVYVIELRSLMREEGYSRNFGTNVRNAQKEVAINTINYLPMSWYKLNFVLNSPYLQDEWYQYFLDILYNHAAIFERLETMEDVEPLMYMGNEKLSYYAFDVTEDWVSTVEQGSTAPYALDSLSQESEDMLLELFAYAEAEGIQLCFSFSPYFSDRVAQDELVRNNIIDFVTSNGYVCLDFSEDFEEIGLNLETDYHDSCHVNVLGAEKYSLYFMDFLVEAFDLTPTETSPSVQATWDAEYADWMSYTTSRKSLMEFR